MNTTELLKYNQAGLIPGPQETLEDFSKRASYCVDLKNQIPHMLAEELPFAKDEIHSSQQFMQKGCEEAKEIYDINPSWVPLFFSNYQLSFWQGGCAWIFQKSEDSPTSAFFQLRKNFRSHQTYLGIYNRDELITHELSHVGRMKFEEPKFEEILAYRSSSSFFRRFFGPIIQSSAESMLFMLGLLFLIFSDIFALSYETSHHFSLIARLLVLGMILFGIIRVCYRQWQFRRCLHQLETTLNNSSMANAVIYRLRDHEIITFGKKSSDEIKQYAKEKINHSLRWKVIVDAYFKDTFK